MHAIRRAKRSRTIESICVCVCDLVVAFVAEWRRCLLLLFSAKAVTLVVVDWQNSWKNTDMYFLEIFICNGETTTTTPATLCVPHIFAAH